MSGRGLRVLFSSPGAQSFPYGRLLPYGDALPRPQPMERSFDEDFDSAGFEQRPDLLLKLAGKVGSVHCPVLPCFRTTGMAHGGLLRCKISILLMAGSGHQRRIGTLPPLAPCLLCSKSGQANACLRMS